MNDCEKILLAHVVSLHKAASDAGAEHTRNLAEFGKDVLLDCLAEMHYPTSEPLEGGCGKLVVKDE